MGERTSFEGETNVRMDSCNGGNSATETGKCVWRDPPGAVRGGIGSDPALDERRVLSNGVARVEGRTDSFFP